jgi:hypothetical protein
MKNSILYKFIIILSILIICKGALNAQSVQFLNVNPDPRGLSMGGASLALDANAYASFNNTASVALSENKFGISAGYMMWQPTTMKNNLLSIAGYGKIGNRFGISAQGRYFSYPSQLYYDENGNEIGNYAPKDISIDLGFSFKIVSNLSMGINARFINSAIGSSASGNAFSADIFLMYKIKKLNIALAATNIGTKISYLENSSYNIPAMGRLGLSYDFSLSEKHSLLLSAEGDYLLYQKAFEAGAGLEYSFNNLLFVRAGYHYGDKTKSIPSYTSLGIGVKVVGITINATYLLSKKSNLKNTMSFSLGYEF